MREWRHAAITHSDNSAPGGQHCAVWKRHGTANTGNDFEASHLRKSAINNNDKIPRRYHGEETETSSA